MAIIVEMQSLYEICLNVISCAFGIIDKNYVKDLPKHILEQVLGTLNPFYLESMENEEFLNLRGVSTDSLWEGHFSSHFGHGGRMLLSRSSFGHSSMKSWRAFYFERHFHLLIHKIALMSNKIENNFQDDLNKELYRPPQGRSCELANVSPPDFDDVIDLCIKHLTRIRIRGNATCVFLAQHIDILMKLAPFLEHVEMDQLRENSVEALINILDVLLENKLKSFKLSNCKIEDVERLRAVMKSLAKSQSLDSQRLIQSKRFLGNEHDNIECGVGVDKEYKNEKSTDLKSASVFTENTKKQSNCNNEQTIYGKDFLSSVRKCDPGKDMINDGLYIDFDDQGNTSNSMFNMDLDETLVRLCQDGEAKHEYCRRAEDDLYEDVFSRPTTLQDVSLESHSSSARMDSSPMMKKSWQTERKLDPTFNQVLPQCLTELELTSCLMSDASIKVLSEELIFFLSLRSLTLCEVGSCSFPAMSDLIMNIKELVLHGSLRYLLFDNDVPNEQHVEMFCDMLVLSCERCQSTQARKGLWSLRLVGADFLHMDKLGNMLRTCSFCEEKVVALHTPDGIWFKTKDNTLHPACKCLNRGVLKPRGNTESLSTILDCSLPVSCKQNKNEAIQANVINYEPDIQPYLVNSVQNNSGRRTDTISSRHEYLTSGLESLYIGFDNMSSKPGVAVFASSLLRNRSLRSISFSSCYLQTEDISNIFDCVSGSDFHDCNTTIDKLVLMDNVFEVIQNNSLCNLLTRSHLVYLDLSYCGLEVIPDDVVLALSSNKFLEVFKIAGNRLGDAGVNQLSKVFTSATKTSVLNTLDLSCNSLTSSSLLDFGNVLTTWPTKLREISVRENPLVDSKVVRECLQKVFNIVVIDYFDVAIDGAMPMVYADYLSEM